ncbi:MAG TPA: apolipoprotein N-acyltransferase, partial [Marinobacter adhaerens]|nr:apolipoprotein N-acyltransferase [Marinobacter adhaerens]
MNSDAKNTRALKTPLSSNALLGAAALLVAGAMQTLTFSPFNLWWLGPVSVLLILLVTVPLAPEKLFRAG